MVLTYEDIYAPAYGTAPDSSAAEAALATALVAGSYQYEGRLEFWLADLLVASTQTEIDLIEGGVSVDKFSLSRRSLNCTIQGQIGDPVSDYFKNYGDLLGLEIKAFSLVDSNAFSLGVFLPDEVDHSQDGTSYTIDIVCADRSTIISSNKRTSNYVIENGTPAALAFENYILDRYPGAEVVLESTLTETTPTLIFGMDEDPWNGANRLAESFGCEAYFDRFGRCVLELMADPRNQPVKSEYSDVDFAVYPFIAEPVNRVINVREIYNGVIVQGEAPWLLFPVCGVKWDTNPLSATYYDPNSPELSTVGPRPLIIKDSLIGTASAALNLATKKFNEVLGQSEPIGFMGMIDPTLEAGDIVVLTAQSLSLVASSVTVDTIEIPLTSDEAMQVGGRFVYAPNDPADVKAIASPVSRSGQVLSPNVVAEVSVVASPNVITSFAVALDVSDILTSTADANPATITGSGSASNIQATASGFASLTTISKSSEVSLPTPSSSFNPFLNVVSGSGQVLSISVDISADPLATTVLGVGETPGGMIITDEDPGWGEGGWGQGPWGQ